MKRLLAGFWFSLACLALLGGGKSLVNVDASGLALQGYDPVAYFTLQAAVKGKPELTARHAGATYRFASARHKSLFEADPAKYVPAFGGYCAYGVSKNKLVKIDPEAFQVVDGRLLVQYSKSVRDDFARDTAGNLGKADQNWPALLEKSGR